MVLSCASACLSGVSFPLPMCASSLKNLVCQLLVWATVVAVREQCSSWIYGSLAPEMSMEEFNPGQSISLFRVRCSYEIWIIKCRDNLVSNDEMLNLRMGTNMTMIVSSEFWSTTISCALPEDGSSGSASSVNSFQSQTNHCFMFTAYETMYWTVSAGHEQLTQILLVWPLIEIRIPVQLLVLW